jgi:hypothetical protein
MLADSSWRKSRYAKSASRLQARARAGDARQLRVAIATDDLAIRAIL